MNCPKCKFPEGTVKFKGIYTPGQKCSDCGFLDSSKTYKITVEFEIEADSPSNASANIEAFLDEIDTYNGDLFDEYSVKKYKQTRVETKPSEGS